MNDYTPYKNLAAAILIQTVKDYKHKIKNNDGYGHITYRYPYRQTIIREVMRGDLDDYIYAIFPEYSRQDFLNKLEESANTENKRNYMIMR